jgi:hypothetical protein
MTAAWLQGQEAGFAWSAAQDNNFSQPHVRVAIVDVSSTGNTPAAQPHLWHERFAFAYPYAAPNGAGTLGVSVAYGGGGLGGLNPSHAVGVLRKTDTGYVWQLMATDNGDNGPADARWGDYLSIRPHGQDANVWVASGHTLHGGSLAANVVPRVVYFQEPGVEPDSLPQLVAELRAEVEALRSQVDQLLERISELESRVQELP